MIEYAMVAGFASVGMDVLLLGPMPTPAVAMLTRSMRADLGVMISASHNSFEDNGIKLFGPDGFKLSDEAEGQIEAMLDKDFALRLSKPRRSWPRHARRRRCAPAISNSPSARFPRHLSLEGLRIVVDCANGAAYKVAPEALMGVGRRGLLDRRRTRRLQHQSRRRLDRAARRSPQRSAKCAPISASRSMATPTAC